jgi:hypothetical protein
MDGWRAAARTVCVVGRSAKTAAKMMALELQDTRDALVAALSVAKARR